MCPSRNFNSNIIIDRFHDVAETPVELSNISTTPHLPVVDSRSGEWIALMDGVEVNGIRYSGNSSVYVVRVYLTSQIDPIRLQRVF